MNHYSTILPPNMEGIKDMLSPPLPMSNHGGYIPYPSTPYDLRHYSKLSYIYMYIDIYGESHT